jgi:hypothetical protein
MRRDRGQSSIVLLSARARCVRGSACGSGHGGSGLYFGLATMIGAGGVRRSHEWGFEVSRASVYYEADRRTRPRSRPPPANRVEDYPPFGFLRERATTSPSIWEVWGRRRCFFGEAAPWSERSLAETPRPRFPAPRTHNPRSLYLCRSSRGSDRIPAAGLSAILSANLLPLAAS